MANYKPGMHPNSIAKRIKPGLKNVAKLKKFTPAGLAVSGLSAFGRPILSALALPLVGGALSLAGGVLHAGAAITNAVTAVSSGVLNAAGGLAGGGQSGNVKKDKGKQMQMVQAALNKKGPTGQGGGSGIADMKSTLADYDAPEGAMSMLPTGDEDGMGMLSGMLHQIAVNTSYLGGIDSKIDALVGLSSISVIDQAQEMKGEGNATDKGGDGVIKRSFNSIKDGFSSMSSSLGGAGKSLIKGLGLLAGFIAFKKFEPQITGGLSSLFENISGFFDTMSEGADPSDGILDYFDNIMDNSVLPALTSMAERALEVIFRAIAIAANNLVGFELFSDLDSLFSKDVGNQNPITTDIIENNQSSTTMSAFEQVKTDMGGLQNMGSMKSYGSQFFGGLKGNEEQQGIIESALKERLEYMYSIYDKTGGRVQWTNIGSGFNKIMGFGDVKTLVGKYSVKSIMTSQPIVDGVVRSEGDLSDPDLLPTPKLTGESLEMYLDNLIENTTLEQEMLKLGQSPGQGKKIQKKQLEFDINTRENKLLLDGITSSGNLKNGDLAAIDMSTNSQHMHDHSISGLTPVNNSNLDLVTFFDNGRIA